MKTTMQIDAASFFVPDNAKCLLGENWVSVPLKHLPVETLAALCDEFRANVFKSAGKEPPPEIKELPVPRREAVRVLIRDALRQLNSSSPCGVSSLRATLTGALAYLED